MDKLKGLSDSSLDPNIVTVSLTQFLREVVGRVLKPLPPEIGPFDDECKFSKVGTFSLLKKVKMILGQRNDLKPY